MSALTTAANAQQPIARWTGFYAGLNLGGASAQSNASASTDCPPGTPSQLGGYYCALPNVPASQANADAITRDGSGRSSSAAFTGGGQIGYNWQNQNWVYGLEGDFGAFHVRNSRNVRGQYLANSGFAFAGVPYTIGSTLSTDWLMTVRGRVGFARSNWLLYATGGLAVTRITVANSFSDNFLLGASESSSESKVKTGFAVGAGGEVALTSNWSFKIEYLYLDFGRVSTQGLVTNPSVLPVGYANALGVSSDLTAHMGRVGFNFKF